MSQVPAPGRPHPLPAPVGRVPAPAPVPPLAALFAALFAAPFAAPLAALFAVALGACSGARGSGEGEAPPRLAEAPAADGKLFTRLPSAYTGVRFANRLTSTRALNVFTYRNFYNGGGVALGDLTGDGLPEIVLTSNQGGVRLYLNEGAFRFRDVTREAGLAHREGSWTTGATLADVTGDGRLDLYVSHAGDGPPERRANALWVHQGTGADGVPRFVDEAPGRGAADRGWSTHAAFLDHDRDGDLDLYVMNNSPRPVSSFGIRNVRHVRDAHGGDRLYRNDGGRFVDVSAAAGIHGSEVAFGLGLAVGDVNRDGWPDLYVANDFFERDYLYVNRGDGTFAEALDRQMPVVSYFSMGMDLADVDNDGWPDVYTTDMLPDDEYRLRTTTTFEGWDVYQNKVRNGYHHQLMRNMLQRNNGDPAAGPGGAPTFSEVAQLAGVAATDWSWGALLADLDLDGRKDIFVTNGIARDVTSQDYVAFLADQETMKAATRGREVDYLKLVGAMTSTRLSNRAFRNDGPLRFSEQARAWGLDAPSFSSGAAYGDLDGDGAPDLVVNNVDDEAFVYRNNARALHPERHFLQLRLEGVDANRGALGARATLVVGGETLMQEHAPARGFQSSVDPVLTFGLGGRAVVDTLRVEWPDGRTSVQTAVAADRRLTLRQADAPAAPAPRPPAGAPAGAPAPPPRPTLLADATAALGLEVRHQENDFVDFDRERLLPHLLSTEGPTLAVGDVTGDGLDDVYLGGAKEQPGQLLVQRRGGGFAAADPATVATFAADAISEDAGATFADVDGDGDQDLYVVSGGTEYSELAPALQDRLYLNDGRGRFTRAPADRLPAEYASGSRVAAADYDGDGDVDLFVGGRAVPWRYGVTPRSLLLRNDGRGRFTDATDRLAPGLGEVGMVTDAVWQDVDGDRRADLVVVGEWMPITVYRNAGGGRLAPLAVPGLAGSEGWWNRIVAADVTGDGRVDFVVGNLGLNGGRLHASATAPATLHVKDFDGNGYVDPVLVTVHAGKRWPLALRDELLRAVPPLKARALKYEQFARLSFDELFPAEQRAGETVRTARTFATSLVRNDGGGRFTVVPLPAEAQLAPVHAILPHDVDADGRTDLLLAGNFDGFKPEIGRMAASRGVVLRGDGAGGFTPLPATASGFVVPGQTRDLARVRTGAGALLLVARNDDRLLAFRAGARPTPARPAPRATLAVRRD